MILTPPPTGGQQILRRRASLEDDRCGDMFGVAPPSWYPSRIPRRCDVCDVADAHACARIRASLSDMR